VRLTGSQRAPGLDVRAAVLGSADPAEVRRRIEGPILARTRAALQHDELPADIRLRLGTDEAARRVQ
jgi:hypothetical protein